MPKQVISIALPLIIISFFISSCGGSGVFQSQSFPEVGVTIEVSADWQMMIKGSDRSGFRSRLQGRPEYIFHPITAAKGDPRQEYANPIPNWRFIGLKGEFDPEMRAMSADYPKPDGLYFVKPQKGELVEEGIRELPWAGSEGVRAVVRLYEETHGAEAFGTSDLWHAYTVTFNHNGNAMEFNFRIPSQVNKRDWIDEFWESIIKLELS